MCHVFCVIYLPIIRFEKFFFCNFLSITKIVTSLFNVCINLLQAYKTALVNRKDGKTLAREIANDIKNMTDLKISAVRVSS
jgi:hypothetical protein